MARDYPAATTVERELVDHTEVIVVAGDLDLFTGRELRAALEDVIWRSGRAVAIDLSEVTTVDTHALAAFLNAARRLASRGRRLVLVAPSDRVRFALETTGVARQVEIADTL